MSRDYYVMGTAHVERWPAEEGEEVGGYEILESFPCSDSPFVDEQTEFAYLLVQEDDIPKEPGVYCLMYVGLFHPYQTYEGEHDVDVEIEWFKVTKLSEKEAQFVLGEDTEEPEQESFVELLGDSASKITRIDDGEGN